MVVDANHTAAVPVLTASSPAKQSPIVFWFSWFFASVVSAITIGLMLTTVPVAAVIFYGPIIAVPQWLLLRAWRIAGWMWLPITIVAPPCGAFAGLMALSGLSKLISISGDKDGLWRWFHWSTSSGISDFSICIGAGVLTGVAQLLVFRIGGDRRWAYAWRVEWILASASGGAAVAAALLRLFPRFGSGAVILAPFTVESIAPLLAASSLYAILTGSAFVILLRRRVVA